MKQRQNEAKTEYNRIIKAKQDMQKEKYNRNIQQKYTTETHNRNIQKQHIKTKKEKAGKGYGRLQKKEHREKQAA